MSTFAWIIIGILTTALGAMAFSSLFGRRSTAVFVFCTVGIPGLVIAFVVLKLLFLIATGQIPITFDYICGLIGGGFLATTLLIFSASFLKDR